MENSVEEVCKVLLALSKISGRNDKEKFLKQNDSLTLRFFLDTLFNSYLTYGVKKIGSSVIRGDIPTLEELKAARKLLAIRQVTGHAAIKLLEDTVNCSNPDVRKCLAGIFVKDLKLGIDVKTVNKVFSNFIPVFDIKFCNTLQGNAEIKDKKKSYDVSLADFEKMLKSGRWIAEPKLDGERCVCFNDEVGKATFYSRGGKQRDTLEHVAEELRELGLKGENLDGEFYAGSWEASVSFSHSTKTESDVDISKAKYYIFEHITKAEWDGRRTQLLFDRKVKLESLFRGKTFKYLVLVPWKEIHSLEEAREFFNECLERGFEGVVFKNLDTEYGFDRNNDWLKWKPFYSVDLAITGYYKGTGKNAERLGGFYVDFNGVKIGIGGGFKEKEPDEKNPELVNERQLYWDNREKMIGKVIEIKHYGVTPDGSLRHPNYLRLREDKS